MNGLVCHLVSGQAFLTGIGLIVLALLSAVRAGRSLKRLLGLCLILGIIAVVLSSAPLPAWLYASLIVGLVLWLISRRLGRRQSAATLIALTVCLASVVYEVPFHLRPTLNRVKERSLCIVGDSVTAGIGGDERSETWPTILGRDHQLEVQDISHMGETAASALKRVQSQEITAPIVLLEIGGNDILGTTTARQFGQDLDALLTQISAPGRQLVMFELPLPPFYHAYGRQQRLVAAKHHVKLIPKRIFLSIIASSAATLDTIHLSQAGHHDMADCVWWIVQSAYVSASTNQ